MVFGNPQALWLLLILLLVFLLGFWGWRVKKNIFSIFQLNSNQGKKSQVKKYVLAGLIVALLIFAVSMPKLVVPISESAAKTGEIILMVDVSGSMAAKKDLDSPDRLERVKPILYEIIDRFPEATFYPFHFTSLARSITPPLAKEDFPYLKRSIARVLDVNSVPGIGSGLGVSISQVLEKIPEDGKVKIIVIFSDGEFFIIWPTQHEPEDPVLNGAIKKALQKNVKIVTVGIGEKEGATIPLYGQDGKFTGKFAEYNGKIFMSYLEEDALKKIASETYGKYFTEEDYGGVIDFLNKNLESSAGPADKDYKDISYLLLIPAAVLWAIFARYYLR